MASTFTVTYLGISGIGAGQRYVYRVVADSLEHATAKAWTVAELPLARIDRANTKLDPKPISITEHKDGPS